MSIYNKQTFQSPADIYAEVKETLRSYFYAGIIDDLLFNKWTKYCLDKLKKSQYKISETILDLYDYQSCLPEDFNSVRELWLCTTTNSTLYEEPSSIYYQKDCRIDIPDLDKCDECFTEQTCTTDFQVVHKKSNLIMFRFKRSILLRPGNMNAKNHCGDHCINTHSESFDTFDVHNNKLITNFSDGTLHLIYYAFAVDNNGEQLVPDNIYVKDYIKKFIIYKCIEQLSYIVTDETTNQIEKKLQRAEQQQNDAFIMAETDSKKETIEKKMLGIRDNYNRNNKFEIPGDQSHIRLRHGRKY